MSELKGAFTAVQLEQAGFTAQQLRAGKFTVADLRHTDLGPRELRAGGYSPAELKEGNFKADELKAAGCPTRELKEGGFTAVRRRPSIPRPVHGRYGGSRFAGPWRRVTRVDTPVRADRPEGGRLHAARAQDGELHPKGAQGGGLQRGRDVECRLLWPEAQGRRLLAARDQERRPQGLARLCSRGAQGRHLGACQPAMRHPRRVDTATAAASSLQRQPRPSPRSARSFTSA